MRTATLLITAPADGVTKPAIHVVTPARSILVGCPWRRPSRSAGPRKLLDGTAGYSGPRLSHHVMLGRPASRLHLNSTNTRCSYISSDAASGTLILRLDRPPGCSHSSLESITNVRCQMRSGTRLADVLCTALSLLREGVPSILCVP